MNLKPEKVHYEAIKSMHWFRIFLTSDNDNHATVIAGAHNNYLADFNKTSATETVTEKHIEKWKQSVLLDIQHDIAEIKEGKVFLYPYAYTDESREKCRSFLKTITP